MAEQGPSLFSRAGKSCTQRNQILKHSASALSPECPKKMVPALPYLRNLRKEEIPKEELDALIEKEMKRMRENASYEKTLAESQEKQAKTSTFRSPGRDEFFLGVRLKKELSPCDHYNVSYSQVDKNQAVPLLNRCRSTPPVGNESLPPGYYEPVPITKKVPSPIPLSLQSGRRCMPPLPSAHEKRFELLPLMPEVMSKYQRSRAPDLSKSLPRAGLMVSVSSPHYNANKEIVMQDLGRTVSFDKISPRRPLFKPISDQVEPYDVMYSQVQAKVPIKNFSKMPPKDKSPSLPLPTFMQDSSSRLAIGSLCEKTIKMHCTRESLLSPKLSPAEMLRVLHSNSPSNKSLSFI